MADPGGGPGHRVPGILEVQRRRLLALGVLGLGYVLAGRIGLLVAYPDPSISAVWPATGVAIAGLILGGLDLWPAVAVGAFVVNLTTSGDLLASLGIATGNTLEGLAGAYLALRFAGGASAADRPETVVAFAVGPCLAASGIAAAIGTTTLTALGRSDPAAFVNALGTWWLGDAVGGIEAGLLILVAASAFRPDRARLPRRSGVEMAVLAVVTIGCNGLAFTDAPAALLGSSVVLGRAFLLLPPLVWAAFRFGPLGAGLSAASLSVVAVVATISGHGPFAQLPKDEALVSLRIFVGCMTVTALLVGAERFQRAGVERELERSRLGLESGIRARTATLATAQAMSQLGTWELDLRSRSVYWSDEMFRIYGYGAERFEVTLERAMERVEPEDRDKVLRTIEDALRDQDPSDFSIATRRFRVRWPSGEVRLLDGRGKVTDREEGRPVRMVGSVLDVTERERTMQALRERQADLVRSNRELAQFAYVASHDLQEPLGTIEGYVRLLRERNGGQLDDSGREFLAYMGTAATRMRGLIDDLLEYGRVGREGMPMAVVPMEVALGEAVGRLRESIERSGAEVVRETSLPPVVGNEADLVRLFQNLVSNAVKFRSRDPPKVRVRARREGPEVVFSVQDNGIGIPPEYQARVFNVFQRLHTREEYEGNGIGLSICKKIVEAHRGRIWIESSGRPADGTTVCFALPVDGGGPPAAPEPAPTDPVSPDVGTPATPEVPARRSPPARAPSPVPAPTPAS